MVTAEQPLHGQHLDLDRRQVVGPLQCPRTTNTIHKNLKGDWRGSRLGTHQGRAWGRRTSRMSRRSVDVWGAGRAPDGLDSTRRPLAYPLNNPLLCSSRTQRAASTPAPLVAAMEVASPSQGRLHLDAILFPAPIDELKAAAVVLVEIE